MTLREALLAAVERLSGVRTSVCFSGGTDSLCVLWSLLDAGADVTAYTFRLESKVSADARVARRAADAFGLRHVEVVIPHQTPQELAADVAALVRRIGSARKTHVECSWPFQYLAAQIVEEEVVCGLNADDLWGSAASVAINLSRSPDAFRAHRQRLMADPTTSAWQFIAAEFAARGKRLASPFRDEQVIEWMLARDWQQLNRPRQKQPARQDFAAEFGRAPIWRPNDNLQCGSGIREYIGRMLLDPAINKHGHRQIAGLYREWLR